jgi:hypothetical protein
MRISSALILRRDRGLLRRAWVVVALGTPLVGGSCSLSVDPERRSVLGSGRPILFIGNSLTYENSLPLIVQAFADSTGVAPLAVAAVAAADYSLEDHWNDGTASETIAAEDWDVVVLQQGPSAVPANRENLREYTARFATQIRAAGARPALYGVWPQSNRQFDFDAAIESYRLAAEDVDGLLFPVAAAWQAAWQADPTLPLYAPDGLHASAMGSYLAALVMYSVLYDASPIGLPPRVRLRPGGETGVTPAVAAVLQQAAHDVTRPPA